MSGLATCIQFNRFRINHALRCRVEIPLYDIKRLAYAVFLGTALNYCLVLVLGNNIVSEQSDGLVLQFWFLLLSGFPSLPGPTVGASMF